MCPARALPQRCTVKLMEGVRRLSDQYGVPAVSHILETYVQKKTGQLMFGRSLVEYLDERQLLYSGFVAIHGVWMSEADIALLEKNGCKAVHNPCCNLKMGSGIAPVKKMLDRIPVGLGTDNISANDSVNLFEAMKVCALISSQCTPDYYQWLSAFDVLDMVSLYGALCAGMAGEIGEISENAKADMILLNTNNQRLITANDYNKALVYSENGGDVKTVIVDGKVVVKDGVMVTLDELELYKEIRQVMNTTIKQEAALSHAESKDILHIFDDVYCKCNCDRMSP
jgi:5-methylthioadenosine/S-adenosylhomocysteine deaminase